MGQASWKKQLPWSGRKRKDIDIDKRGGHLLDDHMKLAWQPWTETEKLTRRLQREFLTIAEFGLMTTMTRKTSRFDVRYIACPRHWR
jgi:hypothetical protein